MVTKPKRYTSNPALGLVFLCTLLLCCHDTHFLLFDAPFPISSFSLVSLARLVAFEALVTLRWKVGSFPPVLYQAMKSERIINRYRVSLHLNVTDVEYTFFSISIVTTRCLG